MTTIRSFRKLVGGALVCAISAAAFATPPSLAVLGFELFEDHPDGTREAEQRENLEVIDQQFRALVQEKGLYQVVDDAPHQDLIDTVRGRVAFVHRCHPCKVELGAGMGTEYVAVGWIQKMSELILYMNVEVTEVATNRVVLFKSVQMRGNNAESWTRAINFLVRDISEKREQNPRHGL